MAYTSTQIEAPEIFIQQGQKLLRWSDIQEIWAYRELIYFLCLRDIKVKYKQAALGVVWVIVQPLFWMVSYTILFGKIAKMDSQGIPYSVFSLAALVPWMFFTGACSRGSLSLVGSGTLFSKVYFPRLIIPLSSVLSALFDYLVSVICLVFVLAFYGHMPQWWWLPGLAVSTLWVVVFSIGLSCWLGALNLKYRDINHLLPFIMQAWMIITPVVYPLKVISEKYRWALNLNPMVGIVESYRAFLFGGAVETSTLICSFAITLLVFLTGIVYFKSTERTFADIV